MSKEGTEVMEDPGGLLVRHDRWKESAIEEIRSERVDGNRSWGWEGGSRILK